MQKISWLIKVSRPRFWVYILGPYLIGAIATTGFTGSNNTLLLIAMGLYFTLPANLLIYGVNDIYDYETDKLNPKKKNYEVLVSPKHHQMLWRAIIATNILFIVPFFIYSSAKSARIALCLFLFLGIFYSAPPIRAKARPFIDTLFNALYVFPALVSFGLVAQHWPSISIFLGAVVWCMAMHAFSAVPDIASDRSAKINTIATVLGAKKSIIFCLLCYALSSALVYSVLGWFSLAVGVLYIGTMLLCLLLPKRISIIKLYKWFPRLNLTVGFALFWWTYLAAR